MVTVEQKLMKQVSEVRETMAKITVVGVGQVGMAATFSMMIQVHHFTIWRLNQDAK